MAKPLMLSVDDEVEQTEFMQDFFEGTHEVLIAHDVPSALRLVEQHAFDVALVDYRLPGGTGFDILRRISERAPRCKRYLLSATDVPHSERVKEPPYTHLGKGLHRKQLVAHVLSGSTKDL